MTEKHRDIFLTSNPAKGSEKPDRSCCAGAKDAADTSCLTVDPTCAPTERILEPRVRHHHRRKCKLLELTHSSTIATMLMLAAAVAALVIENTPLPNFAEFWHTLALGLDFGGFVPHLTLERFTNDFLMVGLEIKFELTTGELRNPGKALLPILGTVVVRSCLSWCTRS